MKPRDSMPTIRSVRTRAPPRPRIDGKVPGVRISQHRGDVVEDDAGPREIGDTTDQAVDDILVLLRRRLVRVPRRCCCVHAHHSICPAPGSVTIPSRVDDSRDIVGTAGHDEIRVQSEGRRCGRNRPAEAAPKAEGAESPVLSDPGRLEAFSDGVLAVAITLLVLDLKVPNVGEGSLSQALLQQWPAYATYATSFLIIGVMWLNHHSLFKQIGTSTADCC